MKVISFLKKHLVACLVFATSLVLGCVVFGDYGIAWDEPLQRDIGQQSFNYLFKGDKTLNKFKDRDYGVAVELPLLFLEQTYLSHDTRDIYRMRHLTVHLFFLLLAPENSAGQHLKALAKISKMLKAPNFRKKLLEAKSRGDLYKIIIDQDESCLL